MNTALWIAQGLLAFVFLMSGGMKLVTPKAKLVEKLTALKPIPAGAIKIIGLLEVLGAIGIVVPALTGILPGLTVWAAVGLALTMIGAALAHVRAGELPAIGMNVVLFALAVFVAWGRWDWL